MNPADSKRYKPYDITPPPPEEYEVRIVTWNTEGVKNADEITNMNDLYIKTWINEDRPQESDTHWRKLMGDTTLTLA